MLISLVELLNLRMFASYSKHAKVVLTPFSYHPSIVKLIILLNDCNGQVLPISEGKCGDSNQ
jgi:hypothetical protein